MTINIHLHSHISNSNHNNMNMDYSLDGEDSAFYAELTRQILMIMDDEDETYARRDVKGAAEFKRSVVGRGSGTVALVTSGGYFSWSESGRGVEVPGWMEKLWASNGGGSGTGVFIPRVVAAAAGKSRRRRRNKQRNNTVNNGGIRIHG
ncbi:hypothetical protein HanRHA438_Chr17g0838441 [Helianthus annuus]|nr:hypothetical protein HanIR_Chr17g0899021 [Helianthus annuus]KAJ0828545.1 hypothetical protein HanRHA438_Chr17g0838441 [Helianthus annuus]